MKIVLFLGQKGGGKTRAITILTRALVNRGWRVGTLKHIHDHSFSVDKTGKDTWLHAASGASLVVAITSGEIVTIAKRDTSTMSARQVISTIDQRKVDYVLVEGFKEILSRRRGVVRVVCARTKREAAELAEKYGEPECIVGRLEEERNSSSFRGVPILQLPRDISVLVQLVGSPYQRLD